MHKPLFAHYSTKEEYLNDDLKWIEPMLAKEVQDEDKQAVILRSSDYIVEEKFDGTRATLHFKGSNVRCFSRRVSNKTGWFCENSDSVPHLRDLNIPELDGTILDGEMFIPNRPFKDVSSTLNCKWDKAIERQQELGEIVFHAFDIIYYKGIRLDQMSLGRRKFYLNLVVEAINSKFVKEVQYSKCSERINILVKDVEKLRSFGENYPDLFSILSEEGVTDNTYVGLTPTAYYQYIVATGGEGVIVKPLEGKYHYKRGYEYTKIKKFLTREAIIVGFSEPTEEYKGKFPSIEKWDYWENNESEVVDFTDCSPQVRAEFKKLYYPEECRPVSKFYAKRWIGNIIFGVTIEPEELFNLKGNSHLKVDNKYQVVEMTIEGDDKLVLIVGECGGFDEEMREYLTENQEQLITGVVEVKANEIFSDTGKLRHPRFLRLRIDKSPSACNWHDHVAI